MASLLPLRWTIRLCISVFVVAVVSYLLGVYIRLQTYEQRYSHPVEPSGQSISPAPGNTSDNLFYFIQISDTHVSSYFQRWEDNLREFVNTTLLPVYIDSSAFVLVTGDVTHAKDRAQIRSWQQEEEWLHYSDVLSYVARHGKRDMNKYWWDVRGNHDNFAVVMGSEESDFFSRYSVTGSRVSERDHPPGERTRHSRSGVERHESRIESLAYNKTQPHSISTYSYDFTYQLNNDTVYHFVSIDACPQPVGPRRPFNFFGTISEELLMDVESMFDADRVHIHSETRRANHTLLFGHYPMSILGGHSVRSPRSGRTLGEIISTSDDHSTPIIAYLSGHLHTFFELIPAMHAWHPLGHLELEQGDVKEGRRYRLLAFDHDLFSFTDEKLGEWPVILVTNPKDSSYISDREPWERIYHSSHVRVLAFSPSGVSDVTVYIDSDPLNVVVMTHVENADGIPLYIAPWTSLNVDWTSCIERRVLTVTATDVSGRTRTKQIPFSTCKYGKDGSDTRPLMWTSHMPLLGHLILVTNFQSLFWFIQLSVLAVVLIVLASGILCRNFDRREYRAWKTDIADALQHELDLANGIAVSEAQTGAKPHGRWNYRFHSIVDREFLVFYWRLCLLTEFDTLTSALLAIFPVWALSPLPWFFGEFYPRIYGMFTTHGLFLLLPETGDDEQSMRFGGVQHIETPDVFLFTLPRIVLFYIPMIYVLSLSVYDRALRRASPTPRTNLGRRSILRAKVIAVAAVVSYLQLRAIAEMGWIYGWTAIVVSPLMWWTLGVLMQVGRTMLGARRHRRS